MDRKAGYDLMVATNTNTKVSHRAWFSHKEYKQLYTATRTRAQKPPRPHYKWHAEQLHDFALFMANTGLRPDEAKNLEHRDVEIVTDEWSGEKSWRSRCAASAASATA